MFVRGVNVIFIKLYIGYSLLILDMYVSGVGDMYMYKKGWEVFWFPGGCRKVSHFHQWGVGGSASGNNIGLRIRDADQTALDQSGTDFPPRNQIYTPNGIF